MFTQKSLHTFIHAMFNINSVQKYFFNPKDKLNIALSSSQDPIAV